jgi:hypothetical protein
MLMAFLLNAASSMFFPARQKLRAARCARQRGYSGKPARSSLRDEWAGALAYRPEGLLAWFFRKLVLISLTRHMRSVSAGT